MECVKCEGRRVCENSMQPCRRRGRMESESEREEPKHFLKAILPSPIHAKQLRIPDEFIARFGNQLTNVATITVPDGCIWELGLKKCGDHVFFCNNWPQFAKYYSVCYGSYLVFKYQGNSTFTVVIFDPTSAEIYYPKPNTTSSSSTANAMSNSNSASERAKAAANEFKPENPYFTSTIAFKRVYVTAEFASKYLKPKLALILKLQNSIKGKQEQWKVVCTLNHAGSKTLRIATGFRKFARDNHLSDGDTCVFELIKTRPVVLQVTAFRALDYLSQLTTNISYHPLSQL